MNLNHIHLGTKNLSVLQNFYESFFDFKFVENHNDGVFLKNKEGFLIAIDPVDELPILPEWYHLGFCVDTEHEVIELFEKMKEGGVEIARVLRTDPGQFASFYVKDPDGNKLEISWHRQ